MTRGRGGSGAEVSVNRFFFFFELAACTKFTSCINPDYLNGHESKGWCSGFTVLSVYN